MILPLVFNIILLLFQTSHHQMSDNGEYSVLQRGHKQQQQQQQHVNKQKQLFTCPHYYNYFRSLPKMCLKQCPVNIH